MRMTFSKKIIFLALYYSFLYYLPASTTPIIGNIVGDYVIIVANIFSGNVEKMSI